MRISKAMLGVLLSAGFALWAAGSGWAQSVPVANPSFEEGTNQPARWTLSGGNGQWTDEGFAGKHAVAVTGAAEDSNYWLSEPLPLEPSSLYLLQFHARAIGAYSEGTPITGPVFCNRDLGDIPQEWTEFSSVFVTPARVDPEMTRLRFGQWHRPGTVAYDAVELMGAQPVYARQGRLELGEGERLSGTQYEFRAPFQGESRNFSRPFVRHQCTFNTLRWVFTPNAEVVYRHEIGGRRQQSASVDVNVNYYEGGELIVEAGTDGQTWRALGTTHEKARAGGAARTFPIPVDMLPANEVWVRLRAGGDSAGSFQIDGYGYKAAVDGEPADLLGSTRFVGVPVADARAKVYLETLGDFIPGCENVLVARIENVTKESIPAHPLLRFEQAPSQAKEYGMDAVLAPGAQTVRVPYVAPNAGLWTMQFSMGPGISYKAQRQMRVADLHDASYGERLPASTEQVGLWWASSGWKVSAIRPVPEAAAPAVVIRAAANETEAAQIVVRPAAPLRRFEARAGELTGPGGAKIPPGQVEVLRVRYVPVTQPTDAVGVAGAWPDPLPPFRGPIDLPANRNQPLWIRVHVPTGTPPGDYAGSVRLSGQLYAAEAPLQVHVYGFTLPDTPTCKSAFGFSPGRVFAYQKLTTPEQQRAVLEKYWADFSAHHISMYNPAPLDPFQATWPKTGWEGGQRDRSEKHGGEASLLLSDADPKANVDCSYSRPIAIPEKGFKLRFAYKTRDPGQEFIVTFGHNDANGQWMFGRNNDIVIKGNGQWQMYEKTISQFPEGAKSVTFRMRPTLWAEDGSTTGTAWFDDVSIQDAGTGKDLVQGGDFEPLKPEDFTPAFDWTAWDAAMTRAFDVYRFTQFSLPVPGLGGGTFYSREEPGLFGYGENTPEYKAAFTAYCQGVQAHLREKGWLDKSYVYWFDEPEPRDYPFVMNGFRKLKEAAPGIGRMLTEQVEPELVGGPNIWCPISNAFNAERAEVRRAAGDHFWWYICTGPKEPYCTLFIDHPATELRVWLWQTWQRHIESVLVWESSYWTSEAAYPDPAHPQNPYEDPMGWTAGYGLAPGARAPWGNGDGRFIYPPEAAADGRPSEPVLEGPVDSIRWEMLRDGVEDYEYLATLSRLLKEHGDKLSPEKRAAYAALVEVPDSITASVTTFTKTPKPIEERRDAVARAIEELGKS